jgi:NADPH-dependent 2,4-dienoyl-CoA reductase/sulfur reductase-like enzyme
LRKETNLKSSWTSCPACQGRGQNRRKLAKKSKQRYQNEVAEFNKNILVAHLPLTAWEPSCLHEMFRIRLMPLKQPEINTENYPHVAIIGGGIGGAALAVACLHRGIPFTFLR